MRKAHLPAIVAIATALAVLTVGTDTRAEASAAPSARPGADLRPAATLRLYPGIAPGSEDWQQTERVSDHMAPGARLIRNVVAPTLEVYLPDPAIATGAGVVVAPGGGMRFLSYDTEGVWVAQWLAAHGIAGFVLKYRTVETPADDVAFVDMLRKMFEQLSKAPAGRRVGPLEGAEIATADGVRGLQVAREHAREWGVDPDRIGFMGFSAGARVTVGVVSEGAAPAFAAPIYGGAFGSTLNLENAPPMFLAVSADDVLAAPTVLELFEQLQGAGKSVELHVYHGGGHGWGLEERIRGASVAHWIDAFYWWLESNGWLRSELGSS